MKVIDLLNKIANGEEVLKFKYYGGTYEYDIETKKYWYEDIWFDFNCFNNLNDEVEVIEDKKIEKLGWIEENTFSKRQNGMTKEDRRLLDSNFKVLGSKIDEIIDHINNGVIDEIIQ